MTQKELDKILADNGWNKRKGKGSHIVYSHPKNPNSIAIKNRKGKWKVPSQDLCWFRRMTGIELKGNA